MKTIAGLILGIFLVVCSGSAFANHLPMPNLPIGETAKDIRVYPNAYCGELVLYFFAEKSSGFDWIVVTLKTNWLAVLYYGDSNAPQKAWLIKNSDGHIDEFIDGEAEIKEKYPKFCDMVKK